MSGLVSFLLFAALFFVMMRLGCGAHAGHGGHGSRHGGHGADGPESEASAIDPVCGMRVEPGHGYTKSYQGVSYRLCSRKCLDKFDASPDQYVTQKSGATEHQGHHP